MASWPAHLCGPARSGLAGAGKSHIFGGMLREVFATPTLAVWLPSAEHTALAVVSVVFLIGLVGCLLPLVPGSFIVWLGVIIYKFWLGAATPLPWWFVFASGFLILCVQVFEIWCGAWGARKFGSTWRGAVGALLGGVIGIFIPPPLLWVLLGPVIGAVAGELLGGREMRAAGKAGAGTVMGAVVAFVAKIAVTVAVVGWFYILVFAP